MIKTFSLNRIVLASTLALAPLVAGAQTTHSKTSAKAAATTGTAKVLKDINNKNCPVSGHPVGSMQKGSALEYKGQKIGLCCDGCKGEFMKNPEAYLEKAKKN